MEFSPRLGLSAMLVGEHCLTNWQMTLMGARLQMVSTETGVPVVIRPKSWDLASGVLSVPPRGKSTRLEFLLDTTFVSLNELPWTTVIIWHGTLHEPAQARSVQHPNSHSLFLTCKLRPVVPLTKPILLQVIPVVFFLSPRSVIVRSRSGRRR